VAVSQTANGGWRRGDRRLLKGIPAWNPELTIESTRASQEVAKQLGRKGSRKPTLTDSKIDSAKKLLASGSVCQRKATIVIRRIIAIDVLKKAKIPIVNDWHVTAVVAFQSPACHASGHALVANEWLQSCCVRTVGSGGVHNAGLRPATCPVPGCVE